MAQPLKSVLWIDDEVDLLESHRIFLREKGFEVDAATNADDAVEMLRRRPYGIVLLDEQMPGKRGLDAYREIRELDPLLPIVMVTKSEEDETLREAIGMDVRDYLVKPINPRQVLTVITRVLDGPRIRQQAIARSFVERFRAMELERERTLDWREWVGRYAEMVEWDIALAQAREQSLYESLQALYPDMRREFASYMRTAYPSLARIRSRSCRACRSSSTTRISGPRSSSSEALPAAAGRPALSAAESGSGATWTGKRIVKRVPSPRVLSTVIFPPIISQNRLEIVRPSPVPPYLRLVDASACVKA